MSSRGRRGGVQLVSLLGPTPLASACRSNSAFSCQPTPGTFPAAVLCAKKLGSCTVRCAAVVILDPTTSIPSIHWYGHVGDDPKGACCEGHGRLQEHTSLEQKKHLSPAHLREVQSEGRERRHGHCTSQPELLCPSIIQKRLEKADTQRIHWHNTLSVSSFFGDRRSVVGIEFLSNFQLHSALKADAVRQVPRCIPSNCAIPSQQTRSLGTWIQHVALVWCTVGCISTRPSESQRHSIGTFTPTLTRLLALDAHASGIPYVHRPCSHPSVHPPCQPHPG